MIKQLFLEAQHAAAGACFGEAFGWRLPLHYGSSLKEHDVVRKRVGVFDVSQMTIVDLIGPAGRECLRHVLANDVDRLQRPGAALYSVMLNHQGGILDDLIVYYRAPDNYRLVFNAATREKVLAWLHEQTANVSVGIQARSELAMLAVQGPLAFKTLLPLLTPAQMDACETLHPFESVEIEETFIASTGYTGESGLEVIMPQENAQALWEKLMAAGVQPCGLAARDSLRLEAGFLQYGQDMDEQSTPYESGLGWTVALVPPERDFIGRMALQLQIEKGHKQKLIGLVLKAQAAFQSGQPVFFDAGEVGMITSGGYSPTLDCSIALARVPSSAGAKAFVEIAGKQQSVLVTKPRFVKAGESLIVK